MEAEVATNDGHRMANDPGDQHSQGEGEAREDGARDYNRERSPFQSERFIISFLNDNLEGCQEEKIGAARDSDTLKSISGPLRSIITRQIKTRGVRKPEYSQDRRNEKHSLQTSQGYKEDADKPW